MILYSLLMIFSYLQLCIQIYFFIARLITVTVLPDRVLYDKTFTKNKTPFSICVHHFRLQIRAQCVYKIIICQNDFILA